MLILPFCLTKELIVPKPVVFGSLNRRESKRVQKRMQMEIEKMEENELVFSELCVMHVMSLLYNNIDA